MPIKFERSCSFLLLLSIFPTLTLITNHLFGEKLAAVFLPVNKTRIFPNPVAGEITCEPDVFIDFNRFRRAAFDAFIIVDKDRLKDNYKKFYLKLVVKFLTELSKGKAFGKISIPIELELRQIEKMTLNKAKLDKYKVIEILGKIFERVKTKFLTVYKHCIKQCYKNLDIAKERILSDIKSVQRGSVCGKSQKYYLAQRGLIHSGTGSILHRLIVCLSLALQTNFPCKIDDSKFHYGPGELNKIFRNLDTCEQVKNSSRIDFIAWGKEMHEREHGKFTLPAVPRKYVSGSGHCHEDISAWYAGVLLSFLMEPNDFMIHKYKQFQNNYVDKINANFLGVHIRSTDKFSETGKLTETKEFISLIKSWVKFQNTPYPDMWIATDNSTHYKTLKETFSTSSLNSLNKTSEVGKRYGAQSLHDFLLDLYMMRKSSVVIGSFSSNMLLLLYELRSVEDIFPSNRLFSLDMYFFHQANFYYRHMFKINSENVCFKNRPSLLEEHQQRTSETSQNNCFSTNATGFNTTNKLTAELNFDMKAPADGFHSFFYDPKEKHKPKHQRKSCLAPLFALDRVQFLT